MHFPLKSTNRQRDSHNLLQKNTYSPKSSKNLLLGAQNTKYIHLIVRMCRIICRTVLPILAVRKTGGHLQRQRQYKRLQDHKERVISINPNLCDVIIEQNYHLNTLQISLQ